MKSAWLLVLEATKQTLLVVGVIFWLGGALGIIVSSGAAAEFYWHNWWMCPVQIAVGIIIIAFPIFLHDARKEGEK